jgi:hypothetical protein
MCKMWWVAQHTELQKIKKNTPAKCVFYRGVHLANYRGCEYYHRLLKNQTTLTIC